MAVSQFDPKAATPDGFLDRLERLVVRLLAHRWRSPRSLWRLELDLLKLERDLQTAITEAKKDRSPAGRTRTAEFRQALWHARRFGDALAWVFFKNERRFLDPLSYNAKNPVPPDDHGSTGMVGAAVALSQRLGFPLLHDITDILRIGDITFVTPEGRPQTVEVKTKLVRSTRLRSKIKHEYHVSAVWPSGEPPPTDVPRRPPARREPPNPRFGRQLARMTRASRTPRCDGRFADNRGRTQDPHPRVEGRRPSSRPLATHQEDDSPG